MATGRASRRLDSKIKILTIGRHLSVVRVAFCITDPCDFCKVVKILQEMDRFCVICNGEGKYKCPTCLVYYCSVRCCKEHREKECDVWVKHDDKTPLEVVESTSTQDSRPKYTSADTVPLEKLLLLKNDEKLKNILCNPHLRELLVTINNSKEPEKIMQMAMQEPLFVEFADACLRVVEPHSGD